MSRSPPPASRRRRGKSAGNGSVGADSSALLAGYCLGELFLVHRGPARYVELLGSLVEFFLGVAVDVDAAGGFSLAGGCSLVRGALLLLLHPAIAHLLELVLQGGDGGAMGPLFGVVLLVGRVEGLAVGLSSFLRRPLDGGRQVFLLHRHGALLSSDRCASTVPHR